MQYPRRLLCLLAFLSFSWACGPESEPAVVPNLNGSWLVSIDLSPSLDGDWTCEVDDPVFDLVQITDTFTGTVQGGAANCVSTSNDSTTVSFDGERIFNGIVDPAGNLEFNFRTIENLNHGTVSADRNSMSGQLTWSFVLPPTISVFFPGTWSAERI